MAGGANPNMTQQPQGAPPMRVMAQPGTTAQPPMPVMATPSAPATGQAAPQGNGVFQTSANLYNQAAAGPNIGQFMNPYTNMVTGNALQSMERQRQMQMNNIGAAAGQAGAFGGSRHGVAEALTNEGFAREGANLFGNLQSQGFNTALNAAQNQQGIQSNLAQQGFNMGNAIGDRQMQQGSMQQQINQMLMDAARGQFAGFTGAPMQALQMPLAAVGAANMGQQTQTQRSNPGALGVLGGLLSIL